MVSSWEEEFQFPERNESKTLTDVSFEFKTYRKCFEILVTRLPRYWSRGQETRFTVSSAVFIDFSPLFFFKRAHSSPCGILSASFFFFFLIHIEKIRDKNDNYDLFRFLEYIFSSILFEKSSLYLRNNARWLNNRVRREWKEKSMLVNESKETKRIGRWSR